MAVLAATLLCGACRGPKQGVALGLHDTSLAPARLRTDLAAIRDLGANSVSLTVYWTQRDVEAVEIRPYEAAGLSPARYDEQVREVIRGAHELGLEVFVVPVVQLAEMGPGQWRGALRPRDWDAWFDSYGRFVLHYARLAGQEGVELFAVGSELSTAEGFGQAWTDLIGRVQAVYGGPLTYSANWDHYREVPFWSRLDYVGISAYHELSAEAPLSYESLERGWRRIRLDLEAWQRQVGKPLMFTEIGYPSRSTAARAPWDYTARGRVDLELQRQCYRAFFRTWHGAPGLAGVYLWNWPLGQEADPAGYSWRGKPAEAEIGAWYRRS